MSDWARRAAKHWRLDGETPVECSLMEWAFWIETADRQVARTEVAPGVIISTVFLGLDHNFGPTGPPLLFETATFDDYGSDVVLRYSSWDEAISGHENEVARLQGKLRTPAEQESDG